MTWEILFCNFDLSKHYFEQGSLHLLFRLKSVSVRYLYRLLYFSFTEHSRVHYYLWHFISAVCSSQHYIAWPLLLTSVLSLKHGVWYMPCINTQKIMSSSANCVMPNSKIISSSRFFPDHHIFISNSLPGYLYLHHQYLMSRNHKLCSSFILPHQTLFLLCTFVQIR